LEQEIKLALKRQTVKENNGYTYNEDHQNLYCLPNIIEGTKWASNARQKQELHTPSHSQNLKEKTPWETKCRWENNTKIYLTETGFEDGNWIHVIHYRVQ
jgi:hypothetical protein